MQIPYGTNKGRPYTEDSDRFILYTTDRVGYGNWDQLKTEIRKSRRFPFDWFIKSRTPQELSRRCDILIRLIEKEFEELDLDDNTAAGSKRLDLPRDSETAGQGKKRKTTPKTSKEASNSK